MPKMKRQKIGAHHQENRNKRFMKTKKAPMSNTKLLKKLKGGR